ncbi:unnamed protein product [Sphagnum jensenii]|uniref:Uncharacterized protein n=1 Tax=Sphagnum jensenii TaxID=128206 RepID=A0ABP0X7C2_9BRYO
MRPKSKPLSFLLFCLLFLVCCASVVSAFRGYDGERYEEAAAAAAAAAAAYSSSYSSSSAVPDVAVGEPVTLRMLQVGEYVESSPGMKPGELVACARVRIPGQSRSKNYHKFADTMLVTVDAVHPSLAKLEVCFHKNSSLGLAQCPKESWQLLQKDLSWTGVMSPFETKFLDVRTAVSHSDVLLDISVLEEQRAYRLVFLALGMTLLLVAPVVSSWVPFYYSSAMTLGVLFVVLVLLYQGMKLLPTGRKSTMYLVLYGSMVGLGTVVLNYIGGFLATALQELGFGENMFNPVAIFVAVAIGLLGAWLGFWGVRKLVLSEDGRVDAGTVTFVKWAIRIVGCVMLLQCGPYPLSQYEFMQPAIVLNLIEELAIFLAVMFIRSAVPRPSSLHAMKQGKMQYMEKTNLDKHRHLLGKQGLALWEQVTAVSKSSVCGNVFFSFLSLPILCFCMASCMPFMVLQKQDGASKHQQNSFYSTFHNSLHMRPLSKEEYKATAITEKAVDDLIESPEFKEWAHSAAANYRISIAPNEKRDEREEDEIEQTADMESHDYLPGKHSVNRRSLNQT